MYRFLLAWLLVGSFSVFAIADSYTAGTNGINSTSLNLLGLDGSGVTVGQVEDVRAADPVLDADPLLHSDFVDPAQVRIQDDLGNPQPNMNIGDGHATAVAGVIISTDMRDPDGDGIVPSGVAQGVALNSSAYVTTGVAGYDEVIVTAQGLVRGNNVAVLNHSWAKPLAAGFTTDGNTILTQGLDWLSHREDVLNIVSGNQVSNDPGPVPQDHYNGVTVARSVTEADGVFRRVAMDNDFTRDAAGTRTSTDLLAPGDGIALTTINNVQTTGAEGTSWATPHVTGTAALLHQHANNQIGNAVSGWNANARRHEVMKSVLMNSVDKLEDAGDGLRLGMTRTVLKKDGTSTWLDSDAYNPTSVFANADTIPLDLEMGAGHLNANRAYQQLNAGEHAPGVVPQVGWDYANLGGLFNRYEFTDPLPAGSFVSITLAWDRILSLDPTTDTPPLSAFNTGDTFEIAREFDEGYNDLDIYLLPKGSANLDDAVARSISTNNLEHVFFQIPTTQQYEFWVYEFDRPLTTNTDYAVAWWAFDGPPGPMLGNGDFDGSGTVDSGDYTAWKNTFGNSVTPGTGADGNFDGSINLADYTIWRDNLGATAVAVSFETMPVPEPTTATTLAHVIAFLVQHNGWQCLASYEQKA